MIKVGDIIDGKRVTKVTEICGSLAYQSEPVKEEPKEEPKAEPKRRIVRRKKEQ